MTIPGSEPTVPLDIARPIVMVSFDPDKTPPNDPFTFVPETVTMWYAGRIILKKSSTDARWRFQGATVKDDTLREFRATVESGDNTIHIFNEMRDTAKKSYRYNVTVELDGVSFTCASPVIVNDPR